MDDFPQEVIRDVEQTTPAQRLLFGFFVTQTQGYG